jgi:hypothetical protein
VGRSSLGKRTRSNPRNIAQAGELGRANQAVAADRFVTNTMPAIHAIRSTGAMTLEAVLQALNQRGIRSPRGGQWRASSVLNLLSRAEKLAPNNDATGRSNDHSSWYRRSTATTSDIKNG